MTPRRGLMSSDTWAGAATLCRNLALNWMLFLPLALLLVWIPKITVLILQAGLYGLAPSGGQPLEPAGLAFWLLMVSAAALYFWSELFTSWQLII